MKDPRRFYTYAYLREDGTPLKKEKVIKIGLLKNTMLVGCNKTNFITVTRGCHKQPFFRIIRS